MKNILLFGLIVFLASCSERVGGELDISETSPHRTVEIESVKSNVFKRGDNHYLRGNISISCSVNSDESSTADHCQIGWDENGRFECTRSMDDMRIFLNNYRSDIDIWEQLYRENLHVEDFISFARNKHGEAISTFNRIDFNFQPKTTTIVYTYELADGSEETVLYSNTYTDRGIADKTYEIDCSGPDGCREIFDFSANRAKCSCDSSALTVALK